MNNTNRLAALAAVALLGGCVSEPRPVATAGQGELIIICTLKAGVDEAAVVPAANDLSRLPGVLDVTAAVGHQGGGGNSSDTHANPIRTRVTFVATLRNPTGGKPDRGWSKALVQGGYMEKIDTVDVFDGTLQNYLVSKSFTEETTTADLERRSAAIKEQNELRARTK